MKFEFDKKYFKICLYAFVTVASLLLFWRMLEASENIWNSIWSSVAFLLRLLSPFIFAIFLAYLLSPAVQGVDQLLANVLRGERHARARKLVSLIFVYLAVLALVVVTFYFVIPGIVRSMYDLAGNLSGYWEKLAAFYNDTVMTNPLFSSDFVQKTLATQFEALRASLQNNMTGLASGIRDVVVRFVSSVVVAVLGLVMSFYLLNEREHIVEGFSRLINARLGGKRAAAVMNFLRDVDLVFGRYIGAKLLLALIMFAMCFVAFSFLGLRYGLLMAAIVAAATLIPYLGPYVGSIPPIVLAFLHSPPQGIYVSLALLIIHQIDNFLFEPMIFGGKMGLSPFWILLAIAVFGGLFGLWGVLLAVPIAGVIKIVIKRYIRVRQVRRQRQHEGGCEPGGGAETSE